MKSAFAVVCAFAFTTALDLAAILARTPVAPRATTSACERAERAAVSEAAARAVVSAFTAPVATKNAPVPDAPLAAWADLTEQRRLRRALERPASGTAHALGGEDGGARRRRLTCSMSSALRSEG